MGGGSYLAAYRTYPPSSARDYYVKVTVEVPPVSVREIEQEDAIFKVWPKPVDNNLNFSILANVKLYDIRGKLVLSAEKVRAISVAHLSGGAYILENEKRAKAKDNYTLKPGITL